MATMKIEHTADGRELVYRVYVHPEVFNWLDTNELADHIEEQFREHLDGALEEMHKELE
jgi:hypothetical protein